MRAPFILDKQRKQEIVGLAQRLAATEGQLLNAPQTLAAPAKPTPEEHPPNIVYADAEIAFVRLVRYDIFTDGWDEQYGHVLEVNYYALVVQYINELNPPRKVGGVAGVSAQLIFTSDDGGKPVRVNRGAWVRMMDSRIPLGPNDTGRLIVAVVNAFGSTRELFAAERESNTDTKLKTLSGNTHTVQIRLISEVSGDLLHADEYKLIMTTEPAFHIAFGPIKKDA